MHDLSRIILMLCAACHSVSSENASTWVIRVPDGRHLNALELDTLARTSTDKGERELAVLALEHMCRGRSIVALESLEVYRDEQAIVERVSTIVPMIERSLSDVEADVRTMALESLGNLGPKAYQSAVSVKACVDDNVERVRLAAARALFAIDVNEAKVCLHVNVRQLTSPNVEVRRRALWNLLEMKQQALPELHAIEACRRDTDRRVRELAEHVVHAIGGDASGR